MKNKLIYTVPVLHLFIIVYSSIFFITETNDSKDYYSIAGSLPILKNSLFPILYPFFLKIFNIIFNNFFVASKVFNCICIFFSLYIAKKYIKEWIVFWTFSLTWGFFPIVTYSWSEILVIPLLLLFYINTKSYFNANTVEKKFLVRNTCILFLLFITKYSLISISLGSIMFSIVFFKNKKYLNVAKSACAALFLSFLYLVLNYFTTGYITGNRAELGPINLNLRFSIYNTLLAFNPFELSFFHRLPYFLALLFFLILGYIYIRRIKLLFKKKYMDSIFLIFLSLFFLFFLWTTYFFIRIDVLNIRLLFPFYFLFFVGLYMNSIKIRGFLFIQLLVIIIFTIKISISISNLNTYF